MKKFLAVIHLRDDDHEMYDKEAMNNVKAAVLGGADGIFLINQHPSSDLDHLIRVGQKVREKYDIWMGANALGYGVLQITNRLPDIFQAIWLDDGMIDEDLSSKDQIKAKRITEALQQPGYWKGTYFGGVAFKYQAPAKSYRNAARAAMHNIDVITTSGAGTGVPADLHKIKDMREAIGDYPLALASGVSADNIENYLPYVDYFLIGTALEIAPYKVSEDRVHQIKDKIITWEKANGIT